MFKIQFVVVSFVLSAFTLTASAYNHLAPPCRGITREQGERVLTLVNASPTLVTCSNYDAIVDSDEFTPRCVLFSHVESPSASPEIEGPNDQGKFVAVWFKTDLPDLNYVYVRTAGKDYLTSLGALIGCPRATEGRMEPYIRETGKTPEGYPQFDTTWPNQE